MARPRGFMTSWTPTQPVRELVYNVETILSDNSDILPLTLRQIFYMMVTGYGYDKTEKAYKRLCETMNKARRAKMISMEDIRDDGLREEKPEAWDGEEQIIDVFKSYSDRFRLDRQTDQDKHLMVWCEAGGMLPQLANYCEDYGVTVLSSGGFDSVTTKHNFAAEAASLGDVEILHIGDHDPSGVHMCSSLDEDLQAFVDAYGGRIEVTRLAVTPLQMRSMGLPTSPPKATDNRSFHGRTTQAEAIPPRDLRSIVRAAIVERMDMHTYNDVLAREQEIRVSLKQRLGVL